MTLPFKLLVRPNTRLLHHLPQGSKLVAFQMPDGKPLFSTPASSELEAINYLFEAEAGRALAMPYWQHMAPLAEAALWLGNAFEGLLGHEAKLHDLLLPCATHGRALPIEASETVHALLTCLQGCFAAIHRITQLLDEHAADPHAKAMTSHPLTGYARGVSLAVMGRCAVWTCNSLNVPVEMETKALPDGSGRISVTVDLDIAPEQENLEYKPGWPTEHARRWWQDRDASLAHYTKWCRRLNDFEASLAEGARLH